MLSDEEIITRWKQILRMRFRNSSLAKLLALNMADELEKEGVAEDDILRLFPPPSPPEDDTYTEGVAGDGAAILKDGVPLTISQILDILNGRTAR